MNEIFRKITLIEVSELLVLAVIVLSTVGLLAATSSTVSFQLTILPPPAPTITAILADPGEKAVLVIGTTTPLATVRVLAFSTPIAVITKADDNGAFFAAFTDEQLPVGKHSFTASIMLGEEQGSALAPTVAVNVLSDYTIEPAEGGEALAVKIGNADPAMSELLRAILRNQQTGQQVPREQLENDQERYRRAAAVQIILVLLLLAETVLLLIERTRRKHRQGQSFFSLGKGWYYPPGSQAR